MNPDIPGKYVHRKNRSHFLELKPDGNYLLFQGSTTVTGRYEVNGDEITISIDDSTSRARIQNGIITDADGDRWIRTKPAGDGSTPIDDDPLPDMTWVPAILRRLDFPWELIDVAISVAVLVVILFVAVSQKSAPPAPPAPPAAPTITLRANPTTINRGQSTTLTWEARNATTVQIAPEVGSVPVMGNRSLMPASSVTYLATAMGPGGTATDTARITVNVPPPP